MRERGYRKQRVYDSPIRNGWRRAGRPTTRNKKRKRYYDELSFTGDSRFLYGSVGLTGDSTRSLIGKISHDYFPKSLSKAIADGAKLSERTNSQASLAPYSRSMPLSSHSTDSGPV